jgi:hypothetical protein
VIRWTIAFLDRPAGRFEQAAAFWSAVTGTTLSDRRGVASEFASLLPSGADSYLRLQAVGDPGGVHLDLLAADAAAVATLTSAATGLGASVVTDHSDWWVLRSPGGLPFCVVPWAGESLRPAPVAAPDGTLSRLDQVSIDVAPAAYDAEVTFWTGLTGWELLDRVLPEFRVLQPPPSLPVRLLLQRLTSDRPTSAHLDLACADVDAIRDWHVTRGAVEVARRRLWTVMRDPAGGTYCLTARDPGTGRLPAWALR